MDFPRHCFCVYYVNWSFHGLLLKNDMCDWVSHWVFCFCLKNSAVILTLQWVCYMRYATCVSWKARIRKRIALFLYVTPTRHIKELLLVDLRYVIQAKWCGSLRFFCCCCSFVNESTSDNQEVSIIQKFAIKGAADKLLTSRRQLF